MDKKKWFTLGKGLDLGYLPNQLIIAIVVISFFVGLFVKIVQQGFSSDSMIFALFFMLSIFFTWALAREFDPKHDYTAIIAAFLVFILYLMYNDLPDVLIILWLIIGLRYVNQTTGMQTSFLDSLTLFVFTLFLMYVNTSIVGVLAITFFLGSFWFERKRRIHLMFGLILAGVWFLFIVFQGLWFMYDALSMSHLLLLFLAVGFFIPVILVSGKELSNDNRLIDLVPVRRMQVGQCIGVGIVVLYTFWRGDTGFLSLVPIWVIFMAAGVYIPYAMLSRK